MRPGIETEVTVLLPDSFISRLFVRTPEGRTELEGVPVRLEGTRAVFTPLLPQDARELSAIANGVEGTRLVQPGELVRGRPRFTIDLRTPAPNPPPGRR